MILMKIVLVSSGSSLSHFLPRYTTVLKPVPKTVTKKNTHNLDLKFEGHQAV